MKTEAKSDMPAASREELLAAYAAGTASPGLSLLCAAHLTLSPVGRAYVSGLEAIGGAMLASEPEDLAVAAPSFEAMLARLDAEPERARAEPAHAEPTSPREAGPLPRPVARALGCAFDAAPWRFRLPGLSEIVLEGFAPEKVSLLRARPGARIPSHTHTGIEATLLLSGAMRDGERLLTAGDIALCGPEHDHRPEIVGHETCHCLVVVDGALRFTGGLARALNLLGE